MESQEEGIRRDRFERVLGEYHGLPGTRITRAATVMQTVPVLGVTTTAVVQTMRTQDAGWLVLLQVVSGDETIRLVLPDKVSQTIYRQRAALTDRSTPESRRRAKVRRDRERAREERAARKAAWRRRHPDGVVGHKSP